MSLDCQTFRMAWRRSWKVKDSNNPVDAFTAADSSLCLARCLDINCMMFTYNGYFDDMCKLYTMAYDETKTEFVYFGPTLHIRVCASTGTI